MRTRPFSELAKPIMADLERRVRVEQLEQAMRDALTLAELRGEVGLTQREVAESLGQSQANVSRIEHEEDLYLSTLREYVAALGGTLQISAVFPDQMEVLLVPCSSSSDGRAPCG